MHRAHEIWSPTLKSYMIGAWQKLQFVNLFQPTSSREENMPECPTLGLNPVCIFFITLFYFLKISCAKVELYLERF